MTTATLTLTDFLLARIAEDEAQSEWQHRLLCMRTACDADGCFWGEDEQELMERERVCNCGYPARVLAECEAKRRIVEWHRESAARDCDECSPRHNFDWPCRTMRALAAVYSDHPDHREEWRP